MQEISVRVRVDQDKIVLAFSPESTPPPVLDDPPEENPEVTPTPEDPPIVEPPVQPPEPEPEVVVPPGAPPPKPKIAMIDGTQHANKPGDGKTLPGFAKKKFVGQHDISLSTRRYAFMAETVPGENRTGMERLKERTSEKHGNGDHSIPVILNQESSDPDVPKSRAIWLLDGTEAEASGRAVPDYMSLMTQYQNNWFDIYQNAKSVVNCPVGIYGIGPTSYKRGTLMEYIVRDSYDAAKKKQVEATYASWVEAEAFNKPLYKKLDILVPNLYLFTPPAGFEAKWGMSYTAMMSLVLTEKINVYKKALGSDMKPVCIFFWWEYWDMERKGQPGYRDAVPASVMVDLVRHAMTIPEIQWIYWWTNGFGDGADPEFSKVQAIYNGVLPLAK